MAAQQVIKVVGSGSKRLLSNKWFWIILASVIALIIIIRYYNKISTKVESRFGTQYGDWQEGTITSSRKKELEGYAQDVYDILACWYCARGAEDELQKLLYLNDNELEYTARYYEKFVSDDGETLYHDVDDEWLAATDADNKLLTRLSKLGLK